MHTTADFHTPSIPPADLAAARRALATAQRVLVFTGAGISRAAGIPTYQDLEAADPTTGDWLDIDARRFASDPIAAWRIQEAQRQHQRRCQPTPAHHALAAWMRHPARCGSPPDVRIALVTQNIDGLHERAAAAAGDATGTGILRLHGSLHRGRCADCGVGVALPDDIPAAAGRLDLLPRCPDCGGLIRPAVVWFGESLPPAILLQAALAAEEADLCLVIGCRLDVEPAAQLPWRAQLAGAHLIEVNPDPVIAPGPGVTHLAAPAEVAVPLLLQVAAGEGAAADRDPERAP